MASNEQFNSSSAEIQPRQALEAALGSRVLTPDDPEYAARIESYWCNSAKLRPAYILQPRSAAEVGKAVKVLADASLPFAVRGGGHTNWAGSNNIAGGVTIDLGAYLNRTRYHADTQLADLEPGAKWKDVYTELEKHGRIVAGGREAEVGVGGYLLGGGVAFQSASYGLACDSVVEYEVVLADGSIVVADAKGDHADLFRVLKGGSNNFGIVTRFTMRTFPAGPMWGGMAVRPMSTLAASADATVKFTANISKDPDSNFQLVVGHQPQVGDDPDVVIHICNNMATVEKPESLREFLAMEMKMGNFETTTLQKVLPLASLPTNYYNIWYTVTFKNDASIILKAAELHGKLVKDLKSKVTDGDFTSHVAFQPLPWLFVKQSHATNESGNILGLEQNPGDAILMQAGVSVRTSELAKWVDPKVAALLEGVKSFASSIDGGLLPWIYLNYAHPSQKVLQSYGPENVQRMRDAASRYDPGGVFQQLCPGGFKISAVS
ncbi:hypothetical protein PG996_002683 [Apiospora saccharicola]|uniref:FAD-binding PCMH-type domain-containing protein n=1 Tax=Apiospora saccharicola TaxID=335842 RepID=A0ABR1WLJ5_9PEZI